LLVLKEFEKTRIVTIAEYQMIMTPVFCWI